VVPNQLNRFAIAAYAIDLRRITRSHGSGARTRVRPAFREEPFQSGNDEGVSATARGRFVEFQRELFRHTSI